MKQNSIFNKLDSFQQLITSLTQNKTPALVNNISYSQKTHLAHYIKQNLNCTSLIITHSEISAKQLQDDLTFFGEEAYFYPSKDMIFYNADVKNLELTKQRFDVINHILNENNITIILSIEALFDKLTPKNIFQKYIFNYSVGDEIELENLIKNLVFIGYERRDVVEQFGQFSLRGGILDIFPINETNAIRLEFFGDEIDSIRLLDSLSQRSISNLTSIKIVPCREVIYTDECIQNGLEKIQLELDKTYKKYIKTENIELANSLKDNISKVIESIEQKENFSKLESYINFLYDDAVSLIHYLPKNSLLIFDEPKKTINHAINVLDEFYESIKKRIDVGQILPSQANMIFSHNDIISFSEKLPCVLLSSFTSSLNNFSIKTIINFNSKIRPTLPENITPIFDELHNWLNNNYSIIITGGNKVHCNRVEDMLREQKFVVSYVNESFDNLSLKPKVIYIVKGKLQSGFEYPSLKFVLLTYNQEENRKQNRKPKKKNKSNIESFTDLKIGDYIVHDHHGIGIYKGIEQINQSNTIRDYLKLQYADGGSIYVNVNQMNFIQKYIGGDGLKLKLSKLNTAEWSKTKSKAKKAIQIIAKDLIKLYSTRQNAKGFQYSIDTVWQSEFEALFPYDETYDQLKAINDVKTDMQSSKVMDRLICGDVGYGKTEVAIRAAFKAVQDGKQVVYLAPTTILAQQHFNNFSARMKDYPIGIELLSRFRTPKQQKISFSNLESGFSDIAIGTHKLFSKDLKFSNVGLLIIDEEQRFGVVHKEKLKQLKENIDVLVLTATPIPRTLHMSLTGIRDMSVLEEPPMERQPIQTYVIEHNTEFIRDALNRELARKGQVYYVHNRVNGMEGLAQRIQELVPHAKVSYAHGQMSERQLENIMIEFIEGNIDVLVCTTIIETGLDIQNANTIIIQDADHMGLSQLYQLRGRVGRSNRLAYAYFTYKENKVLTEVAEKRLQAIRDFTAFGSGFKIAMRDLEIRGAGNLLGAEQHGHIDSIGYDMYCKLLSDAIKKEQGEVIEPEFEATVDIVITAYIPTKYISNEEQKLEIYKKISNISSTQDYFDMQEEIEDRFGTIPKNVANLLYIALIKAYAIKSYVSLIKQNNNELTFVFDSSANLNFENITKLIDRNRATTRFVSGDSCKLIYTFDEKKGLKLSHIKNILRLILGNEI